MALERAGAQATIRIFHVSYQVDLDQPVSTAIPLGVFGELRLQSRYAIGLVARRNVDPAELHRVGRLAKAMIAEPFAGLRRFFNQVWESGNPQIEFERITTLNQSSLVFSFEREIKENAPQHLDIQREGVLTEAKSWSKSSLRKELRRSYIGWINDDVSKSPDQSEEVDEVEQVAA